MYQEERKKEKKSLLDGTFGLNKLELLTQLCSQVGCEPKSWASCFKVIRGFVQNPLELYQLEKPHHQSAMRKTFESLVCEAHSPLLWFSDSGRHQ